MAAKKKIESGSWQVLVEHLESQNRLTAEGHEVTRREIQALDRKLTTRMDDLERAAVATRADLSKLSSSPSVGTDPEG